MMMVIVVAISFLFGSSLVQAGGGGIDQVLAGLSTPELRSILDQLNDDEYESLSDVGEDDVDYYLPPVGLKQVDARASRSAQRSSSGAAAVAAAAAMLPTYCDPPNPCPPGYTKSDGCIEDFENTSDFSRNYQSTQNCICDTEHMFNCPSSAVAASDDDDSRSQQQNFISQLTLADKGNPFLAGTKLPIAAKKGSGISGWNHDDY